MTNPAFTTNFVAAPPGSAVDVGITQGDDIIIRNSNGPDYMFYGELIEVTPDSQVVSVTWDGFNDGPKDGILVIHTLKGVFVTQNGVTVERDVNLPKGHYKVILRDDPSPSGQVVGETAEFVIF